MWFLNAQLFKQMLLNPVPSKQAKLLVPLEIYFTKNLCTSFFMQKIMSRVTVLSRIKQRFNKLKHMLNQCLPL